MVDDDALWHSDLLFDFCGGHRIELVECLRSDKALFDAYSCLPGMYRQAGPPLSSTIAHYRQLFPVKGPTPHNLCISHEMRIKINRRENQRLAPQDSVLIKVKGSQIHRCAAQTMLIWPGLKLLGCVGRIRKGVRNGVLYTVTSCEDAVVKFEELPTASQKMRSGRMSAWQRRKPMRAVR